jgi:hypothetical protein
MTKRFLVALILSIASLATARANAADFKLDLASGGDTVSLEQVVLPQKDGAFRVLNVAGLQCNGMGAPIHMSFTVTSTTSLDVARGYGLATALLLANGIDAQKIAATIGIIGPDYSLDVHKLELGHVHPMDDTQRLFVAVFAVLVAQEGSIQTYVPASGYFKGAAEQFGYSTSACH